MVVGGRAAEDHADRIFRALADRTRRDIVRRAMGGTLSVSGLARLYPMSTTAVQKHVAVLGGAGLVRRTRRGREPRVCEAWGNRRELERWWGPPTYPATVVDHDLTPGGRVTYYMTAPDGEKYHGWWRVIAVDPPHSLVIEDGFADDSGRPNDDLPTTSIEVRLTAATAATAART